MGGGTCDFSTAKLSSNLIFLYLCIRNPVHSFGIELFMKKKKYKHSVKVLALNACCREGLKMVGGVWAPGTTAGFEKEDKAPASPGSTASAKSKLSLLISFQNLRDPTSTSEEAVCCRRRYCSGVSLKCSVDLRENERKNKRSPG